MSRTNGLCGALSGGIMALGLLFGRASSAGSHYKVYALTERLIQHFEAHFGSRNCSELLGCNLGTVEGDALFKRENLGETFCLDVTVKATEMVMRIIEQADVIQHSLIKP